MTSPSGYATMSLWRDRRNSANISKMAEDVMKKSEAMRRRSLNLRSRAKDAECLFYQGHEIAPNTIVLCDGPWFGESDEGATIYSFDNNRRADVWQVRREGPTRWGCNINEYWYSTGAQPHRFPGGRQVVNQFRNTDREAALAVAVQWVADGTIPNNNLTVDSGFVNILRNDRFEFQR